MKERVVIQFWRGLPGVYYPDQVPPAGARIAAPKPAPAAALRAQRKPLDPELVELIVSTYRTTGSLLKTMRAAKRGIGLVKRVIQGSGADVVPWRRSRNREADQLVIDTYRRVGSVDGTAKALRFGVGRIQTILKEAGEKMNGPGRRRAAA